MDLSVQKRDKFGKQVRSLRDQGLIPAELYGRGIENLHLAVPVKDFEKTFKKTGENTIVNLVVENEKYPVLIYDLTVSPVTDEILSVDFYRVKLDEKIKLKVPVAFVGESAAVKAGGILVKAVQEIEVEALPANVPRALEVDLSKLLEVGQSIYVKDLSAPPDIKLLIDPETVVATVTAPLTEEQEAALSQTADVSAIKVETEEKKAERAAKTAAAPEEGVAEPEKK